MFGRNVGEVGENLRLQIGDFRDGFNDKVDRGEILHLQTWNEEPAGRIGGFSGNTLLGNILLEKFV